MKGILAGELDPDAADAWDGYCATTMAEAGVKSLETGSRVMIKAVEMPHLYTARRSNTVWEGAAQ